MATLRRVKPSKPYAEFPLTPYSNGQWGKKIRGKQYCFGPWKDPDAALRRYHHELPSIQAGDRVLHTPEGDAAHGQLTVADACNLFLEARVQDVQAGKLTQRSWDDYKDAATRIVAFFGRTRDLSQVRPRDFAEFRAELAKGFGVHALARYVRLTRTIFNYSYDLELVDQPIRFGKQFRVPSTAEFRKHRAKSPARFFEAEELRGLLKAVEAEQSSVQIRAMLLLGINCGFINVDCCTLRRDNLSLESTPTLSMPRQKTGIQRRSVLWPETVDALNDAIAGNDPKAGAEGLVLLTCRRDAWKPSGISHAFRRVAKRAGVYTRGCTFSALRHTFRTVADETRDIPAVRLCMGHADNSIDGVYREHIKDDRLQNVADHVRVWLFGDASASSSATRGLPA